MSGEDEERFGWISGSIARDDEEFASERFQMIRFCVGCLFLTFSSLLNCYDVVMDLRSVSRQLVFVDRYIINPWYVTRKSTENF
jgi:hypothetical protein